MIFLLAREILILINNYYLQQSITIVGYILAILGYIGFYVLLVIRIRQHHAYISRQMRIIAMTLTTVGFAVLLPVHISYYRKVANMQLYGELVLSAILLLIYFDIFTISISLLYLTRTFKSQFFWRTVGGGLLFILAGDTFYRYFFSIDAYVYGSYPDVIFNLAYGTFFIGMLFISQKKLEIISVVELDKERKHYQELYSELIS